MAVAAPDRAEASRGLLDSIVNRIVAQFHPERIVLFGSRAYGTPREDSDIDLLVVMESDLRPAQRSAAVALSCHPGTVPMDVIVRTPEEIKDRLALGDLFLRDVLDRGEVLYEHPR